MRSPVVAGKLSAASLHWSTPARKNETFPFSWLMRATRAGGSLAGTFSWLEGEACAGRHHDGRANSSDTNTTKTAVGFSRTSLEHLSHSDASDCRHLQQFIVRMKSASEKARNAGYAPGQRSLYDSSSRGTAPIASSSQDQLALPGSTHLATARSRSCWHRPSRCWSISRLFHSKAR